MALTVDTMNKALSKYTFPALGSDTASPSDEVIKDAHGVREMLLWAAEVRWDVNSEKRKSKDLLDAAVDRAREAYALDARRIEAEPGTLVTSPLQATKVFIDDAGQWAWLHVYGRIENVQGRKS